MKYDMQMCSMLDSDRVSCFQGVAAALTVASVALADAGIHMYDLVIGTALVSSYTICIALLS